MRSCLSVRTRLVATVLLAVAAAWAIMHYFELAWIDLGVALAALVSTWLGAGIFVSRPMRRLRRTAEQLAAGDSLARTGLARESGDFGVLAQRIDAVAEKMQERARTREITEKTLLSRSLQQTVVSALGQFALVSTDLGATVNQAVMMIHQTLDVEFCNVLKLSEDQRSLLLHVGVGWKPGLVGQLRLTMEPETLAALVLKGGEPVVTQNLRADKRFTPDPWLLDHGIVSGITVAISSHGKVFGLLGGHTTRRRMFTDDEIQFMVAVATVLSIAVEREQAEARRQKLAAFAQLNPNPAMELAADATLNYSNDAALKLAKKVGNGSPDSILPGNIAQMVRLCLNTGQSRLRHETKIGPHTLSWSLHPFKDSRVVHAYIEDITERLSLEAQFRQSQKMESVGQLAAGVAHDFNNMLTVIQGHAGILFSRRDSTPEVKASAQAISFASERSAALTRQLLVFSRKSVLQPKSLDVGEVVVTMSKMLARLLGETIHLELERLPDTPAVYADAGMLEQVLMNLGVNARDAMPRGGTVRISTYPVSINEEYVRTRTEAREGMFVCLRVTDTGCGMDAATKARIFEPFFTTKEVGKGTGLGLATVYGIVKQHNGWVDVESEPGKGTSFFILLPATQDQAEQGAAEAEVALQTRGGTETILVVEDEEILREMATSILQDSGYQVLSAGSGPEALALWEKNRCAIDLLLTDMVLPGGISGIELARRIRETKPSLKVILASGYSLEDFEPDVTLQENSKFIQKPYTHGSLMRSVRDSLDGPERGADRPGAKDGD